MQWSDEDFRKRVEARALALGKTLGEVGREAGLAVEYFRKPPAHGRNIAGIYKIAKVLNIDPAELMGLRRADEELAKVVTVAASIYFQLSSYPPHNFPDKADEIIPRAIAKALKLVRQEFEQEETAKAEVPKE